MIALFRNGYDLDVRSHDGRNFLLLADKDIMTDSGTMYRMPKGAISDGASIPQLLWGLGLAPFGPYWPAAYAHDCAYRGTLLVYQLEGDSWEEAMLSKDMCDELLKALMFSLGVDQKLINVIYDGVHVGGIRAFRDDRQA